MSESEKRELRERIEMLANCLTVGCESDTPQLRDYRDAADLARGIARFIEERIPGAR